MPLRVLGAIVELWHKITSSPSGRLFKAYDEVIDSLTKRLEKCEQRHDMRDRQDDERDKGYAQHAAEIVSLKALVEQLEHHGLVASVTSDEGGLITGWNPAATTLFLFTREEAIGKSITILTPFRYRQRHLAGFRLWKQGGMLKDQPMQTFAQTRHGLEIPVTITLNTWEDEGKRFIGASIVKRVEL